MQVLAPAFVIKKEKFSCYYAPRVMDGLCAVPVKDDKNFQKLRSKINLDRTLKLTSDFDLHPALKILNYSGIKMQHQYFMQQVFLIKKISF